MTDDAESGGAVVDAPCDSRRRKGAGDVAFVRRRIRRVKREELADVLHPAAEEVAEGGGGVEGAELLFAVEHRLLAVRVPKAHMNVAARSGIALVPLGHERDRVVVLPGDLFCRVLVQDVTIGHLERICVAQSDLLLSGSPFALR